MSKPDWADSPDWAEWLAKDKDGFWWWHEAKPIKFAFKEWVSSIYLGKVEPTNKFDRGNTNWEESLERRP